MELYVTRICLWLLQIQNRLQKRFFNFGGLGHTEEIIIPAGLRQNH